jgi:hypothetical protein
MPIDTSSRLRSKLPTLSGPLLPKDPNRRKAIEDRPEGNSVVGKETPYYPQKHVFGFNRNGQVSVFSKPGSSTGKEPVLCKHLAMAYLQQKGHKRDFLKAISSPPTQKDKGIENFFSRQMWKYNEGYESLTHAVQAEHGRIFESKDVGVYFCNIASAMVVKMAGAVGPCEANVMLTLRGGDVHHALAAKVEIKDRNKREGARVCISVYDPNKTVTHVRMEANLSELKATVEGKSLGDFLLPNLFRAYQNERGQIAITAVCMDVGLPNDIKIGLGSDNELPDADIFCAAMRMGDIGLVEEIGRQVRNNLQGPSPRTHKSLMIDYLINNTSPDNSPLRQALRGSSPEAIKAYFNIFNGIGLSESDLEILVESDLTKKGGFSAMVFVLAMGCATGIQSYVECVDQTNLSSAAKAKALLAGVEGDPDWTAFDIAMDDLQPDENLAAWMEGVRQAKNLDPRAMLEQLGEATRPDGLVSTEATVRRKALADRNSEATTPGQPAGSGNLRNAYEAMVASLKEAHALAGNNAQTPAGNDDEGIRRASRERAHALRRVPQT